MPRLPEGGNAGTKGDTFEDLVKENDDEKCQEEAVTSNDQSQSND